MEDDWDLHAVVRGCAASLTTTNNTNTNNSTNNNPIFHHSSSNLHNFHNGQNNSFDPFVGLQEIYTEFCFDQVPPPIDTVTSAVPVLQQSLHETVNIVQPPVPHQMNISQENIMANNSQPVRTRRRKNQPMKMIRQMTQEELSADAWAWRKYGQKPIKGSAYPRNYYRCSTSKGCAARKQVERNPTDPVTFVVAYCGDHTHPRPTHRSSLAGTTRTKLTAAKNTTTNTTNTTTTNTSNGLLQKGSNNSTSPSGSGFSPDTPLEEGEGAAAQNDDVEDEENDLMMNNYDDNVDDDNDDDDVFSGGLWNSTSSAEVVTTFNG